MVESNHDEERLARIERMIEDLQRESATLKTRTDKIVDLVQRSLFVVHNPTAPRVTPQH